MGYSHYYTQNRELTRQEWTTLTQTFRQMLHHLPQHSSNAGGFYADKPLIICGSNGRGRPEITQEFICFNGQWNVTENLSHEAFVLGRCGDGFQFCKTARKPYDLLVCAVLLAVTEIAPAAFDVRSDGDMRGAEWQPAREFLRSLSLPVMTQPQMSQRQGFIPALI